MVGSQAVQDVLARLDRAYQDFFSGKVKRPPKFKKVKKYRSFTLKQSGWKMLDDMNVHVVGGNQHIKTTGNIVIQGVTYKFVKHRVLEGTVKTVTIKRDACGRLYVCFSVVYEGETRKRIMTGQSAGLDFGLKTFLTDDNGNAYQSPEFLRQELACVKHRSKSVSRKCHGSKRKKRARYLLNRTQIRVADKREDSHYKLAHHLCQTFDTLYLETLNIQAMKQLWGRKVSDVGFGKFVTILKWIARKYGTELVFIDRFEPTSQLCSHCGNRQDMPLRDRSYTCNRCGLKLDRDHNAAKNIKRIGASIPLPEACQTGVCSCLVVDGRSLHL